MDKKRISKIVLFVIICLVIIAYSSMVNAVQYGASYNVTPDHQDALHVTQNWAMPFINNLNLKVENLTFVIDRKYGASFYPFNVTLLYWDVAGAKGVAPVEGYNYSYTSGEPAIPNGILPYYVNITFANQDDRLDLNASQTYAWFFETHASAATTAFDLGNKNSGTYDYNLYYFADQDYTTPDGNYQTPMFFINLMEDSTPIAPDTHFTLKAENESNAADDINTFTANVTNGTHSLINSTTNGELQFAITGQLNITVGATNWTTKFYNNLSVSAGETVTAQLKFKNMRYEVLSNLVRALWGNTTINNYNFSFYNTNTSSTELNQQSTSGKLKAYLNWDFIYTVTISAMNYLSQTFTMNSTADYSEFRAFDMRGEYAWYTTDRRFRSKVDNSSINAYNLSFYNMNESMVETTTQSSNGSSVVSLNWSNRYNITIYPDDFEVKSWIINTTDNYWELERYFYTHNSINFTFYDEETNVLINDRTTSIKLISDIFTGNYTTTTGVKHVDLLSPTTYTIRYSAPGYQARDYYFTLYNRTGNDLKLYLLNTTSASEVTATVYDEDLNTLEGALIYVYKFDITTNSYIVREILTTNFEGESQFYVTNDEFYKFKIYYGGDLVQETEGSYIFQDTINFYVSLDDPVAERFYSVANLLYTMEYLNDTKNLKYSFTATDGLVTEGCLKTYIVRAGRNTLYNSSCTTGASGIVYMYIENITAATYKGNAYVYYGSEEHFVDSYVFSYRGDDAAEDFGNMGFFIILVLTIVLITVGFWSLELALLLAPLPIIFGSLLGIVNTGVMPVAVGIGVEVIALVIIFIIRKD